MNDATNPDPLPESDAVLEGAGARLRSQATPISASAVEVSALRGRTRRMGFGLVACVAAVAVLGGALALQVGSEGDGAGQLAGGSSEQTPAERAEIENLVASLDPRPVDPTEVRLVSTVSNFDDCEALVGNLRRVGAEHVGSRGFGGGALMPVAGWAEGDGTRREAATSKAASDHSGAASTADETTLGTNVQVSGVDELDFVKAVDNLIYDLDGKGHLRITDATTLDEVSATDLTPPGPNDSDSDGGDRLAFPGQNQETELLVLDDQVVAFGTEVEISDPVEGDPSASRATTSYLTLTFVDTTDPAQPEISDRIRVEGSLVSARLVDGEVRMVTTAHMADLGFVMPTTPNSITKALEQNRRSVAGSTAADWIPDWQRDGEDPQPLVPCDRVHVPDTFAGVAMTSMVTFPIDSGRFEPQGTSILAPGTTLYAGLEKVAISSEVWVDPVDRDRLSFDDWQTAIHEFSFTADSPPSYEGSGIVDGSTVGQFAFGEIGDSLAVVTTEGTPWSQNPETAIDLTVLTPDGDGGLTATAEVADLADGQGTVSAVRFVEGRVLVSTGAFGRTVEVIDVGEPTEPRRAGSTDLPGAVGYFHPLPEDRVLVVGSRWDSVGSGDDTRQRNWVQVNLLDVSDPDSPQVTSTWERPWSADQVGGDHHAFTYWPDRHLAMWGLQDTAWTEIGEQNPNHALVLNTDGALTETAVPVANKPNEAPPPCPAVEISDSEAQQMVGRGGVVLRCDDASVTEVEWPRYSCFKVEQGMVDRFVSEDERDGAFFLCSPAGQPNVSRVLVVGGTPILLTDQTLEALDPDTFASTKIAYHPTGMGMYW